MRDTDIGKRMVEEMVFEQLFDSYPLITGRTLTDDWDGEFPYVEGSPDFIVGVDGKALGIELAERRGVDDVWGYYEMASSLACKKHESYVRRGLFGNPIALVLHSHRLPLSTSRMSSPTSLTLTSSRGQALRKCGRLISPTCTTAPAIRSAARTCFA